ncbi:spermidine synthase [Pusillimonas sp. CC-YST705]|uniref:Spermidine synthase n=1 Tax=Mesopusillimonas faecipullorum TaxID=2755040 RepID=A0ABS8CAV3_9BURK|nr:spermidine synthase [Mesopusillimonas faecipullorum]MCB5363165.1 spermidine synthase [Mesopusillimonas faecipullorum]
MSRSASRYEPWEDDEPTLSELSGVRYLHFGTEWVQGAMRVRKPDELVLAYTKQMMAWLLFQAPDDTQTLGMLGLGAGSLLRFALKHTPAQLVTVEWNPNVTAMCHAYFKLPSHARSRIVHEDAGEWVMHPENTGLCSALMVDLYDATAQGPVRDSLAFYQGCRQTLAPGGIMTVNLFGEHESFPRNMTNIGEAFSGRVLALPEVDAGNRIVLAFRDAWPDIEDNALLDRAQALEAASKLPAMRWARHVLAQLG